MSKPPRAPAAVLVVAMFAAIGAQGSVDGATPPAQVAHAKTSNEIFRQKFVDHCSSCHGLDLAGGRAPSLFDQTLVESRTDEALHHTIESGRIAAGMPAFKDVLSDHEIWQLILFLRTSSHHPTITSSTARNKNSVWRWSPPDLKCLGEWRSFPTVACS